MFAVLKGYTVRLSPLGQTNLAPTPPWRYSSDVVAAKFWVMRDAAEAAPINWRPNCAL